MVLERSTIDHTTEAARDGPPAHTTSDGAVLAVMAFFSSSDAVCSVLSRRSEPWSAVCCFSTTALSCAWVLMSALSAAAATWARGIESGDVDLTTPNQNFKLRRTTQTPHLRLFGGGV
jgi:hypothetical protein